MFRAALIRVPAPLLVLAGMFALHAGSALAVLQFDAVGTGAVTWLRLTWAALLLLALSGPALWRRVRAAPRRDLWSVVILGTVSAGMMAFYSEATARIDLGTATSLEFLGPLAVAVVAMRRRAEVAWILAAVAGVACMTRPWAGDADLAGIAFGVAGAVCVALYIVLAQRVSNSFGAVHGLALSLTVASVVTAPLGVPGVVANPDPRVLGATLGIALLFPLVPFLLEMVALQRMRRSAYSTFVSLEPAVSLVMGLVIIAQTPQPVQLAGMALVVVAGIGSARGEARPRAVEQRGEARPRPAEQRGDARPDPGSEGERAGALLGSAGLEWRPPARPGTRRAGIGRAGLRALRLGRAPRRRPLPGRPPGREREPA
ncbi:inner membrane transporter RhtA [Murinocardiopsis flavida]|uniref:Inner membrane transporter RhtA n=1 Tax=Murinocardiopsis flavida TaxID=645275 RepID=A0A2P8DSA2_9ACTN|nr:EamA family transporter [Murinocardiopsis flavida]PSL00092.1 inner membrane transporter RhtA [Murinocardiopsis flavida]